MFQVFTDYDSHSSPNECSTFLSFIIILFNRSLVCCLPFFPFPSESLFYGCTTFRPVYGLMEKKKKEALLRAPFAMRAAERRKNEKESYKWNHALLFRRIELLSARARAPQPRAREARNVGRKSRISELRLLLYVYFFISWASSFESRFNVKEKCVVERSRAAFRSRRKESRFFFFLFYYFPDFFWQGGGFDV